MKILSNVRNMQNEGDHFGDVGVDGRIILNWELKRLIMGPDSTTARRAQ